MEGMIAGILASLGIDPNEIQKQITQVIQTANAKLEKLDARLDRIECALKIENEHDPKIGNE
jgi:hypothetical protein